MAEHLGREEVTHIASLARLALSEEELVTFAEQLSAVLDHVDALRELDIADLPPMHHPLPLQNVLRPDEVGPSLDRDEVLAAAPAAERGRFRVPRILAEEP
ncbi:MAG TPA: Asp-tRNA(Asn)/Glu-tRNA(Gln) amidotransferase subunit GatC [Acidimicrobiales bacterium]|nr:Asp-tRNA(Asn)/Glu-tRNA(Gln) amidotransferase subunit GatC [Acidimicrobiales bacterium]